MNDQITRRVETNVALGHLPLISWRSVLAGLFVSLLVAAILTTLGIGIGGNTLVQVFQGDAQAKGLGVGSGIWFLVTCLIALFAGGYFAARVSNFVTARIGSAQGLVIAALFFAFVLSQLGVSVTMVGKGVGAMIGKASAITGDLAQNPTVQSVIDQVIADQNLRSDPDIIIQGVARRLIDGRPEAARNYLAAQTGMSRQEAAARLETVQNNVKSTLNDAGAGAAKALSAMGWTLFAILVLGSACASGGGALGSRANFRAPIAQRTGDDSRSDMLGTPAFDIR